MATFYLDFEGGDDSKDGTTFANRWKTITNGATAARLNPGDTIRVMKSPDPVSLGVNGTFTKKSDTITLASAVTTNVSLCQAAWTASANVTTTTSTTRKEGTLATSIAPAAAFTTGLLAYEATASTLDLSSYQKVSFWIRANIALAANSVRLDLCSDTAGATAVNSFTADVALEANVWRPFTFDNGSALGNSIKSVALTALTDFGATTILLDNIIATNNLSLTSVIGASSSATGREWYAVRSVNDTSVIIDRGQNDSYSAATIARGFSESTTTTTAYVREPIYTSVNQSTNEAGTAAARYIFSGGWDRTNMTSQDGMTFFTRLSTSQVGLNLGHGYIDIEYFGICNNSNNLSISGAGFCKISYCFIGNASNLPIANNGLNNYYNNCYINSNTSGTYSAAILDTCVLVNSANTLLSGNEIIAKNCTMLNSANGVGSAPYFNGVNITIKDCTNALSSNLGINIDGLITNGNSTVFSTITGNVSNWSTSSDTTLVASSTNISRKLYLSRYSTYAGVQYNGSNLVVYDTDTPLHGTTSRSWRHDVTANNYTYLPIVQRLQPFAVAASSLVTFKIWVYRTSTNVEGRVRLRGYVTPGVDADVTATITAAINTWQELTVTCTPSAAGVVQIDLESYSVNGSTGTVYFGDATVSQA